MKKLIYLLTSFAIVVVVIGATASYDADAQFLKKLGKKIQKAAEEKVEEKAEQKTKNAVGEAIDDATDPNTYKGDDKNNQQQNTPAQQNNNNADADAPDAVAPVSAKPKSPELAYNKFDYVAGDVLIFDDDQAGELVGEFPSKWDLVHGEAEIAKFNGENVIVLKKGCYIRPLMKDIYNYLGDVFTIEFDYWFTYQAKGEYHGDYWLGLIPPKEKWAGNHKFDFIIPGHISYWNWDGHDGNKLENRSPSFRYGWHTTSAEQRSGNRNEFLEPGNWVHISLSFNKRAMKIYINENRIGNIPNMTDDLGWLQFQYDQGDDGRHGYMRRFRIAKGAVPLYDRMMTDGKFITYGITFDVGKSVIKPESMGEMNRIVTLMTENTDLKFSVEGHTDNTGNAATNQTLSDARSKAVVDKLIEMGIAADRLKSAGKGQTSPIAENDTDEGRAKNRRVEFVKI
ncbi:MAG: OmpA family protein [Ignavibacteria bacterium]|jgi:outer membrane protein OmpA-like peptidoglycan-associated protein|nr:OmpA family protein [Ignavibacteria bacterium]